MFGATAYAQTGAITGTILDATNSGVPGATVTATNLETGSIRKAITDATGTYLIPDLAVGAYDVSVEKEGFAALRFRSVRLTVAQNLTLNGSLEIGPTAQSVEVSGASLPPITLEDAQISNVVDSRRIQELPLITRDPYQLVLLSPGSQVVNSALGGFSVNGQRERDNNFLLDGTDNNDAAVPGIPGGVTALNPDATQEFRVITNNFLPEFGRNNGAVIDVVTRSGTNQFHGDAYEFNRVNAMAARDWFNPSGDAQNPDPQNPFVRNQFGFSFGGPIVKNKTFFFVNSEWDRFRTTLTNQTVVPTPAFKSGIFTYDGQQINLANPASPNNALGLPLSPSMQKVLALYPNPNGPAVDSIRALYFFPTSIPLNSAGVTYRVDHQFSEKYTAFARYIYNGLTEGNSLDEFLPGLGGVATGQQTQNGAIGLIATLRPNLVNELRAGLNRGDLTFTCHGVSIMDKTGTPDQFGFGTDYNFTTSTNVPLLPGGSDNSSFGCGPLGHSDGQSRLAGTWHVADNLSWTVGRHNFKAGGEFRYV
ncbi:MAG TPA: carboxypeptidase-like regulatory domain-containing protein, partial [Bryobacteraceae bacterium]